MNERVYRWLIFGIFSLAYLGVFAQRMGMAVITPDLQNSLGLTPLQLGTMGSVSYFSYAICILFAGFIASKFGAKLSMALFFGLGGLGTLMLVSVDSFNMIILGVILIGLGSSIVVTAGTTSFSSGWFSMKEYGNVISWFFLFGGIGNIIGAAPLAWMVNTMGWKVGYGSIAVLMIAMAIAAFFIVKKPSEQFALENGVKAAEDTGAPKQSLLEVLGEAMKNKNFWCIAIWYGTIAAVHYSFNGMWAGKYMNQVFGLERMQFGAILTLGAIGFAFGNSIVMWLCNKFFHSFRIGMALVNIIAVIGAAMIAFGTDDLPYASLFLVTLFIGLAVAASSIAYTATRVIFGARMAGPLAGVWSFVLFGGGGLMNLMVGYFVNEQTGTPAEHYHTAFIILFCCSVIGTIAGLMLKDVYKDTVEA